MLPNLPGVRRALIPALLCAAVLTACGSSQPGVTTYAAYHGPPVPPPVPVSSNPQLRAADTLCLAVIPGLRTSVRTAYTLDPESLSAADLQAQGAAYTADAQKYTAFARELSSSSRNTTVRALAVGLHALGAAMKVLGRSVSSFAVIGGGANIPGAQAAVASDIGGVVPYARIQKLPDCAP